VEQFGRIRVFTFNSQKNFKSCGASGRDGHRRLLP
jgi:hypothetical protein